MGDGQSISSVDGQHWWSSAGPINGFELAGSHGDIKRLVLGNPGETFAGEFSVTLRAVLGDVQQHFPNLTHLHVWGLRGLGCLAGLPHTLKCLDLRGCADLTQIADLPAGTRLETLDLGGCAGISAVPAGDYSELRWVWLNDCRSLQSFALLQPALKTLQQLELHGCRFRDLSAELCGVPGENVVAAIRQHFAALQQQGAAPLAECKVIVLGNGGDGKTELVRALKGLPYDKDQKSTHGIQLWKWGGGSDAEAVAPFAEHPAAKLQLNIWDFGGQDLYHNTHRLFMETQAVFVVVERHPRTSGPRRQEHPDDVARPLDYWLDQVSAVNQGAGKASRVLIVRSAIDEDGRNDVAQLPHWQERVRQEYRHLRYFELSAVDDQRQTEQWQEFRATLLAEVREELGGAQAVLQPRGRVAVRAALQDSQPEMGAQRSQGYRPLLHRHEFETLVQDTFSELGISRADAEEIRWQLDFFHQRGVVYAPRDWVEQAMSPQAYPVVVDQRWIIEGIYQLIRPGLRGREQLLRANGRVTRKRLERAWDDLEQEKPELQYDDEARCAMLAYMESSGVLIGREGDWILPEFLPPRADMLEDDQERPLVRQLGERCFSAFRIRNRSLGLGFGCQLLQWFVQTFGAKNPMYRYGGVAEFRVGGGVQQVPVEIEWNRADKQDFAGDLVVSIPDDCPYANEILDDILERLQQRKLLPAGASFEAAEGVLVRHRLPAMRMDASALPDRGRVSPVLRLGRVGISMAGGPAPSSPLEFWPRLIQEMLEKTPERSFDVLCYRRDSGIPSLTKLTTDLAGCDVLIAVVSNKYLSSPYCLVELLLAARQWSRESNQTKRDAPEFLGDYNQWLPRIRFVILPDALWIVDGQPEDSRIVKWKRDWQQQGSEYVARTSMEFGGRAHAMEQAPQCYAEDAWLRFADLGPEYPDKVRQAIAVSTPRTILRELPGADSAIDLDQWGRGQLQSFVQELQVKSAKVIGQLGQEERIRRAVTRALESHDAGNPAAASQHIDDCLRLCLDSQQIHAELLRSNVIRLTALEPLRDLLPAWRSRQGVPPVPPE